MLRKLQVSKNLRKMFKEDQDLYKDLWHIIVVIVFCGLILMFTPAPAYIVFIGGIIMISIFILPKIKRVTNYIYSLLSWVFGITAVSVLVVYTVKATPPYIVGDNLVLIQVEVLPGLYMKPITIFMFSFFLWFVFGLYTPSSIRRFEQMLPDIRRILYAIAWLSALASGFEIVYHAVVWSAALSVQGLQNPDIIVNPWPTRSMIPINIVFATKIVVLVFALSCFVIDYIKMIESKR
ncbi:hypothetical protein KEJ51_03030 [Candidatus Bathyarchaeota archaeon]|nr:hypothetical protein [Candidatus Bathyarchaeota archaeon]MBS7628805.1 hypothetical protein [Candidatus Bathyarchaeota archaeon]